MHDNYYNAILINSPVNILMQGENIDVFHRYNSNNIIILPSLSPKFLLQYFSMINSTYGLVRAAILL